MVEKSWRPLLEAASGDVRRLDHVVRFSSIPVVFPETVSAHSFWVSLYAIMIHRHLEGDRVLDAPVLLAAVTHDVAEAKCGDLVRTFKYSTPDLKAAVKKAENLMVSSFPPEITSLMREGHGLTPPEASYVDDVVKAADFMSLYEYMWRERLRGNAEIEPFFQRMIADLKAMGEALREESINPGALPHLNPLSSLYHEMANTFSSRMTA